MRPSVPSLPVFCFLWGFAIFYHQVAYRDWLSSPFDVALTLAAVANIVRPADWRLLGMLSAAHVAVVVQHLPEVLNHWYFAGLVSLGLLVACVVVELARRRPGAPRPELLLASATAPAARLSLLLLYALTGFHKLNRDFFDPAVSCAPHLASEFNGTIGVQLLPESGHAAILMSSVLTVAVELGVPLLLAVKPLRRAGIVAALGFHVVMAIATFPRFSATCTALLTLFVPAYAFESAASRFPVVARLLASPVVRGALVAALVASALTPRSFVDAAFLGVQLLTTLGVFVAVVSMRDEPLLLRSGAQPARIAWSAPALIAPALILFFGLTPYLGLGTERAFGMYSNLRTEGGHSNHYLVPARLQAFDYQHDLVEVLESSTPWLSEVVNYGKVIPYQELRGLLSDAVLFSSKPVSVRYRRGGIERQVADVAKDSTLALPVSWLERKFLRFRAVEPSGPRWCGT